MSIAPVPDEDLDEILEVAADTSDIAAMVHEIKMWRDLWGGLAESGDYGLVVVRDDGEELSLVSHPTAAAETLYPSEATCSFLRRLMPQLQR